MPETALSISKISAEDDQIFFAIREKGIAYLQKIAGDSWTDHNLHDPGITLLEAICYVLTEINHHFSFPIEDLIASLPGLAADQLERNYPTPGRTLSNKAVTINDFRKLVIDLPEIKNAYFEKTTQSNIAVYYSQADHLLKYEPDPEATPVIWGGLYGIQLEFENDAFNSNFLPDTITVNPGAGNPLQTFDIAISFQYWDEMAEQWFRPVTITGISLDNPIVALPAEDYEDYYAEFSITFSAGSPVTQFSVWIRMLQEIDPADPLHPLIIPAIQSRLLSTAADSFFIRLKHNLEGIFAILSKVNALFQSNRNVCEDLEDFIAIRSQEIALNTIVEISPTADPVEILAQILFKIEAFFSPYLQFHTLKDLLDKKALETENIFDGPVLNSGFLLQEASFEVSRRKIIYVSDLVQIIMGIEGSTAVRDIFLNSYFDNFNAIENERNCIRVRGGDRYKPKLSISRSEITLTRNGLPIAVDENMVMARFAALRDEAGAVISVTDKDLQIPIGNRIDWGDYRSIQYELPTVYGVGNATPPASAGSLRLAQAKQLQGYLFFFDQILANTYAQIIQIEALFSVRQVNPQSYSFLPLYQLPGIHSLIGHLAGTVPWADFVASPDNAYIKLLRYVAETPEVHDRRRNLVLDHLLARFAENRDQYSAIFATILGNINNSVIQEEKASFLEALPSLSQERAQAYDHLARKAGVPDMWDSFNVGGYVRMVSKKSGFPTYKRRNLFHTINEYFEFFDEIIGPSTFRKFRLRDANGNIILISFLNYPDDDAASKDVRILLEIGRYPEFYQVEEVGTTNTFIFKVTHPAYGNIAQGPVSFAHESNAQIALRLVAGFLGEKYAMEGIHMVEHILLRPKIKGTNAANSDRLLALLKVDDFELPDPYSNIATVVLPSGYKRDFSIPTSLPEPVDAGARLRNPEFAQFVKKTILMEAPAHLLVNVVTLDVNSAPDQPGTPSLQNFERVYKTWLEKTADPNATQSEKIDAQHELVIVLENIYAA